MKNVEDIYPLSPMQQGMLFHALEAPDSEVYCEQVSCSVNGNLRVSAFKQAWRQVIQRHSILRTLFVWQHRKKPLQVVRKRVELPWVEEDWRGLSLGEQQARLQAFLQALQALIAHCQSPEAGGFTPSDFPEAELSQEELEELISEFTESEE